MTIYHHLTDTELLRVADSQESRLVAEMAARIDSLRCTLDRIRDIALNLDDYSAPNACDEIAKIANSTL